MRPGRAISRRTIAVRPGPAVALPSMRSVLHRRESLAPAARGQVSGQDLVERLRGRGRRGEEHRRREEQAPPHALTSASAG